MVEVNVEIPNQHDAAEKVVGVLHESGECGELGVSDMLDALASCGYKLVQDVWGESPDAYLKNVVQMTEEELIAHMVGLEPEGHGERPPTQNPELFRVLHDNLHTQNKAHHDHP